MGIADNTNSNNKDEKTKEPSVKDSEREKEKVMRFWTNEREGDRERRMSWGNSVINRNHQGNCFPPPLSQGLWSPLSRN